MKFVVATNFAGGLTLQECEHYYACLEGERTASQHSITKQRPSVVPLSQATDGKRPSCLRQGRAPRSIHKQRIRRSASISHPPRDHALMTEAASRTSLITAETIMEPKVAFKDHIIVVPILSLKDYPAHVRHNLWMTYDELAFSMRQAKVLEMKERREREIEALQEIEADTKGRCHISGEEDSMEEEDSMDFMEAMSGGLDEDHLGLDNELEALYELSLSQQIL